MLGEGRLMMAFDGAYLTQRLSQVTLHGRRGLVGSPWTPGQPELAFTSLDSDGINVREIPKAASIMEFLTWDMSARKKVPLSAAAIPLQSSFEGNGSSRAGSWFALKLVGEILSTPGSECVKGIVFDAATTHSFVRRVLQGQTEDLDAQELSATPFFGQLDFIDPPRTCLPRLPLRLPRFRGDIIWGIPGACGWAGLCV